ncbi:MAG: hypothetical protein QM754_18435 [Tepidisphaeraceae bacterium]
MDDQPNPPYRELLSAHGKGKTQELLRRALRAEVPRGDEILDELTRVDAERENLKGLPTTANRRREIEARYQMLIAIRDHYLEGIRLRLEYFWRRDNGNF